MIEICCADYESVEAAAKGGAGRVELCSGLSEGGLTPSHGLIKKALSVKGLRVHVLIRPRRGDFVYSPAEVEIMEADILEAKRLGAHGVVIGALHPDGSVDRETTRRLREAAGPMYVTFHRAFDVCADLDDALEAIAGCGCDGVLTSGQKPTAFEGIANLKRIVERARGRLDVIAACGVNSRNVAGIVTATGVADVHASASHEVESAMTYRNPAVSMGGDADEYRRRTSSVDEIRRIVEQIDKLK